MAHFNIDKQMKLIFLRSLFSFIEANNRRDLYFLSQTDISDILGFTVVIFQQILYILNHYSGLKKKNKYY